MSASRADKPRVVYGEQLPSFLPEVLRRIERKERERQEWIARYGHIRPHISTDFKKHKFVVAGQKLYYARENKWNFVTDFLCDYVPMLFGREWFEAEVGKPQDKRHPVFQCRADGIRYMQAQGRRPDGTYFINIITGPLAAYMAFAFNLFAIEDNSRFDDSLLERLKNKDQFQGARHEVFAEATCLRAGFSIEHENERDRSQRHAEFTARHKETGQLISVEAKSRHRPGILGQKGSPGKLSLRFGSLLNDAIAKNPKHPLVVFIDVNLPYAAAERVLGRDSLEPNKPTPVMRSLLDRDRKAHGGKDLYAMLVFTNHPHHYVRPNDPDPLKHVLAIVPTRAEGMGHHKALTDLFRSVNQYGVIPDEFPPH